MGVTIRDALDDASLLFPEGAGNPIFDDDRLIAYTTIVAMSAKDGEEIPMGVLTRDLSY